MARKLMTFFKIPKFCLWSAPIQVSMTYVQEHWLESRKTLKIWLHTDCVPINIIVPKSVFSFVGFVTFCVSTHCFRYAMLYAI